MEATEEPRAVAPPGSLQRARLEALLGERRYEDALGLVRHMQTAEPGDPVLARCVVLLEERLIKDYRRAIGDLDVPLARGLDGHVGWSYISSDASDVAALIDGRATASQIMARSSLPRFAAHRALAELAAMLLVEPSSAPVARPRWRWAVKAALAALAAALVTSRAPEPAPPPSAEPAPRVEVAPPPPSPAIDREEVELVAAKIVIRPSRPPPVQRARLAVGGVMTNTRLSDAAIRAAVERQAGRLRTCHARTARKGRPEVLRAVLIFDHLGRVRQAAVSPGAPRAMRACMRESLEKIRPGVPEARGARASFTLAFG